MAILSHSCKFVNETFSIFCDIVEGSGWRTSPVQLRADEWRAEWMSPVMSPGTKKNF
jgi:hypothetical protein